MKPHRDIDAFFSLLRGGLWENSVSLKPKEPINFEMIYQLADEQSVVGLVAAGLEHIKDRKVAKSEAISFLKKVVSLEQRNESMNLFIARIVPKMFEHGIDTVLVKGQGVAQCYSRPEWRSAGDVDLFFDAVNYERAKGFLIPLSEKVEVESRFSKHLGLTIDSWIVELHGTLRCGLSPQIDIIIDLLQKETFHNKRVRVWNNRGTVIPLPNPDNDAIFIFTHFLTHFYKGGVGLRQICDWCRLLWTYRQTIDVRILETRLRDMRLLSEWKAFASFSVTRLGMPIEAMPLYSCSPRWLRKSVRIERFLMESGNFGHNRDQSYYHKYPFVVRKVISFGRRFRDLFNHMSIFPLNSLRFMPNIVYQGVRSAMIGE